MKEIIIPELEEEIKKLPKQYVDSESVCKRYPLRYYEVKALARSCNSFRMIRQSVIRNFTCSKSLSNSAN